MNKLIIDLENNGSLAEYLSLSVSGLVINTRKYSVFNSFGYEEKEIANIASEIHKNNKKVFLNVNKIIEEDEIDEFAKFVLALEPLVDYIIYSDFSLLQILSEKKDKLIYDSKTLVASFYEADEIGTHTFLSHELSFEEIVSIVQNASKDKKSLNCISLDIFGYHPIMYSRRPLLSLYNDFFNTNDFVSNKVYSLKEEMRDDIYKILQSDNGTYIYSSSKYILSYELKEIIDKLMFLRINSVFLSFQEITEVVSFYNKYLDNKYLETFNDELLNDFISKIDNISSGFLHKKLYLLKGDNDE